MTDAPPVYKLNLPPERYVSVPAERLREFVQDAALALGLPETQAGQLAELLTGNDLRGVHSHGTRMFTHYADELRGGRLNPAPKPRVTRETPVGLVVDGDGGLGYFAAHLATERAIAKAREIGVAVAVTRNHGHIGAAGIYARMTLPHDLLCLVTGGARLEMDPGMPVYSSAVGSPMCFSAPAGDADPLVVDFSPVYDLRSSPHREELEDWIPGTIFRCIGLGNIAQAWGGILAGVPQERDGPPPRFASAHQAAAFMMFRIDLFLEPAEFRRQMDVLAERITELAPLPGFPKAQFAGAPEAERARRYAVEGIPVGDEHRRELEALADDLGIEVPWERGG
ncbi:MAG: Ldh family oxidoreductase [Chloroflexota bacterium]|nr:Ldh family oxidoreductase [Chloroflexota bacterium]